MHRQYFVFPAYLFLPQYTYSALPRASYHRDVCFDADLLQYKNLTNITYDNGQIHPSGERNPATTASTKRILVSIPKRLVFVISAPS